MTSPLERRYRRVLRLLPAGYRQAWEEDMVSAYMERAGMGPRSLGERLSVVALAIRLRLAGRHSSPRGAGWRHAMYGFAMLALLHQALFLTVAVADLAGEMRWRPMEFYANEGPVALWTASVFALLWVGAYGCAVLGLVVARRIVVVLAAGSMIAYAIVAPLMRGWAVSVEAMIPLAWYALVAGLVIMIPNDTRPSRRLWLGVYLVGALVLAPFAALHNRLRHPGWLDLVHPELAWRIGLVIVMAVVVCVPALRRSPGWPLGLAAFSVLTFPVMSLAVEGSFGPWPFGMVLDTALIGLGVICAILGLVALRRRPGEHPDTPAPGAV